MLAGSVERRQGLERGWGERDVLLFVLGYTDYDSINAAL